MTLTQPPKRKGFLARWGGWIVLSVILLAVLGGSFAAWVILDPHLWLLNQGRYKEIVRRVELLGVPAGEERDFLVSRDKDPASVRVVPKLQDLETRDLYDKLVGGEVVHARRTKEGRLIVRIMMPSRRPTYGLVYSGGEPEEDDLKYAFGIGGMYRKLDDHWWAIEDRSD